MDPKTALITGSNGGLGHAIAARLATQHDMRIVVAARKLADTATIIEEIERAGGHATGVQMDVTDAASVASAAKNIRKTTNALHVLVNCAGINSGMEPSEQSTLSMSAETAMHEFDVNAMGALRVIQAVASLLRAANGARIVNVSTEMASLSAMVADFYPLAPSYRISKAALNALTILIARDMADQKILVNAYSPGWLRTRMGGPDAPFSAEEGAETAAWLATLPDDGPTGGFFAEMRRLGGAMRLAW